MTDAPHLYWASGNRCGPTNPRSSPVRKIPGDHHSKGVLSSRYRFRLTRVPRAPEHVPSPDSRSGSKRVMTWRRRKTRGDKDIQGVIREFAQGGERKVTEDLKRSSPCMAR